MAKLKMVTFETVMFNRALLWLLVPCFLLLPHPRVSDGRRITWW